MLISSITAWKLTESNEGPSMAEAPRVSKLNKFLAVCALLAIVGGTYSGVQDHQQVVELNRTVADLRQERNELRAHFDATVAELVTTRGELDAAIAEVNRLASQPAAPASCGDVDPRWCTTVTGG